jgi:transposase
VLVADRGYDHDAYRRQLGRRGIRPQIARRQTAHGSGLGRVRWPVERSLSWLHQFAACWCASSGGPICTRRSRCSAACLICLRKLQGSF